MVQDINGRSKKEVENSMEQKRVEGTINVLVREKGRLDKSVRGLYRGMSLISSDIMISSGESSTL